MSDHPSASSAAILTAATSDRGEADRIHLRDHLVAVEVGAFADERDRTQRLRFHLDAALDRAGLGAGDEVDRVLSYEILVAAVRDSLAERRFDLLEALAEAIAARVLRHPGVASVRVTVEKLDRVSGTLGVTITRAAARTPATQREDKPVPSVLGPEDWRRNRSRPLEAAILVPEAPGLPLPQDGDSDQIALLALDQGAWSLAGRLGLAVAATRTELQAAAAAGVTVVWAPARMVREASDLAPADRTRPEALARWLARRLG